MDEPFQKWEVLNRFGNLSEDGNLQGLTYVFKIVRTLLLFIKSSKAAVLGKSKSKRQGSKRHQRLQRTQLKTRG